MAEHVIRNGQSKDVLENVRAIISGVYDYEYLSMREMYGGSNDDDDLDEDGGTEYGPTGQRVQQFNPKSGPQPYTPIDTPWTDDGFVGLDPPVG